MQFNLESQSDAIVHFIQEMDIELIDLILDKDKTYQDFSKQIFIEKLGDAFDMMKLLQNEKLIGYQGSCNGNNCPNFCKSGYSFIGNYSKHKIDMIFDVNSGRIMDIFECSDFQIETKEKNTEYFRRIYIDRSNDTLMKDDGTWDIF